MTTKDSERADPIRERAREDFASREGVTSWKTCVTVDPDRPILFAEIYTFPDHDTAKRVTLQFAEREPTRAFPAELDRMLVGQYAVEHRPSGKA